VERIKFNKVRNTSFFILMKNKIKKEEKEEERKSLTQSFILILYTLYILVNFSINIYTKKIKY